MPPNRHLHFFTFALYEPVNRSMRQSEPSQSKPLGRRYSTGAVAIIPIVLRFLPKFGCERRFLTKSQPNRKCQRILKNEPRIQAKIVRSGCQNRQTLADLARSKF
jgi:hypothetical protein